MNKFQLWCLGLGALIFGAVLSLHSLLPNEFKSLSHDVQVYYCYNYLFQRGYDQTTPQSYTYMCGTYANEYPLPAHHFLPNEYPILSLIPFLFGPPNSLPTYNLTFEILMSLVFVGVGFILYRQRKASLTAFLIYSLLGNIVITLNRFDLIPSLFVLLSLISALKKQFLLSYLLLAISVMFKLYSLPLLLPLFIAEQQQFKSRTSFLQRLRGIAIFLLTIILIQSIAVLINPANSLNPLAFFLRRPVHIDSLAASVIWLLSTLGVPSCIFLSYNSLNIAAQTCSMQISSGLGIWGELLSLIFLLTLIGLSVKIITNQVKQRLDLPQACIGILLAILITNKVFSPQYLLWVSPLIAFRYGLNLKVLIWWSGICLLTSLFYPFLYGVGYHSVMGTNILFFAMLIRNCLLLIFTIYFVFNIKQFEVKNSP